MRSTLSCGRVAFQCCLSTTTRQLPPVVVGTCVRFCRPPRLIAMLARSAPLRTLARRLVHTEARIAELGHTLPSMPSALGLYVPAVRMGNVIHTAGHIPFDDPLCEASNPLAPAVS